MTLFTLSLIGMVGLMTARLILKNDASDDPLAFAIATIVCGVGEAVTVALILGAVGLLRIDVAILSLLLLSLSLWLPGRSSFSRTKTQRLISLTLKVGWGGLKAHPALAVCAIHLLIVQILYGLIQPPLSNGGLVQHLSHAAGWLQEQSTLHTIGSHTASAFPYQNPYSSFWLWWWIAPSHSDTYAGLANLIHWLLVALSVGGIARQLGAKEQWPLASVVVFLVPTVVRSAVGHEIQFMFGAYLLAGCFFASRWVLSARWMDVLLAAIAGGVAVGVDELGVPYTVVLGAVSFLLVNAALKRRIAQTAMAGVVVASLGGFFYVQKMGYGLQLLAPLPTPFASSYSEFAFVIDRSLLLNILGPGKLPLLANVLLGGEGRRLLPLAFGPQFVLFMVAITAIPFCLPKEKRRVVVFVLSLVLLQILTYLLLLPAARQQIIDNTRHLIPLVGIGAAAGLAILESRGVSHRRIRLVVWVLAVQDLLLLHSVLPQGLRIAMAWGDGLLFLLLLVASFQSGVWRRKCWRWGFVPCVLGILMVAPWLAEDRVGIWRGPSVDVANRLSPYSGASTWLARNGGTDAVVMSGNPFASLTYPAMGSHFQRRVLFVTCSKSERKQIVPCSDEHVTFRVRPLEWRRRLVDRGVRWVWAHRSSPRNHYSREGRWASRMSDHFTLRYDDKHNRIFELN